MGTFRNIEEARTFFSKDRFASENGMEIKELRDGMCVCEVVIRDCHRNAVGGVMGGVIFTLADFAASVAWNNDHKYTVSLDANISFLAPVKGEKLSARAEMVKSGRNTCVYQVSVTDETGNLTALMTASGFKLSKS